MTAVVNSIAASEADGKRAKYVASSVQTMPN